MQTDRLIPKTELYSHEQLVHLDGVVEADSLLANTVWKLLMVEAFIMVIIFWLKMVPPVDRAILEQLSSGLLTMEYRVGLPLNSLESLRV